MNKLLRLLIRDIRFHRGRLIGPSVGLVLATAMLTFFLSLGLGVRSTLVHDVFPVDKIEFEPHQGDEPGLLALLTQAGSAPHISEQAVAQLRRAPGVSQVYPKLKFAFPASARGGADIIGHDIGTSELMGDGVEPELVQADMTGPWRFEDPWAHPGNPCHSDQDCRTPQHCESVKSSSSSRCIGPVPVLISQYLVELFNKNIAPAHHLPAVGASLIARAKGLTFQITLGSSLLGSSKKGEPRVVTGRIVGVSRRAMDLGITVPLTVVQRWNQTYAGEGTSHSFTSVLVETKSSSWTAQVMAEASKLGLEPTDTRARDVSVLMNGMIGVLALISGLILLMGASNITYGFRALLNQRRGELGLYRAVGASRMDILGWQLTLAAMLGAGGGLLGLAVGWIGARAGDWAAARYLPPFPFKPDHFFLLPWWLGLAAIAFSIAFALVGAASPAWKASQVDPSEALSSFQDG